MKNLTEYEQKLFEVYTLYNALDCKVLARVFLQELIQELKR